jgi:arylsulfatase A-like enzyme
MGLLGDAIEEIDWSVGEILGAIKDCGIDDNTLVIFTSDNGPAGRQAGPLRGSKASTFEGGVREPCIMRWPAKIHAGTTCDKIAGNIDVLPTLAKLAGGAPPANRVIDGRDITSLMFDRDPTAVRDAQLYFTGTGPLAAIRQGDWKLFLVAPKGKKGAKEPKDAASGPILYNLKTDPAETTDVSAANPEVVARLKAEAAKRDAEIRANQRPAGKIDD